MLVAEASAASAARAFDGRNGPQSVVLAKRKAVAAMAVEVVVPAQRAVDILAEKRRVDGDLEICEEVRRHVATCGMALQDYLESKVFIGCVEIALDNLREFGNPQSLVQKYKAFFAQLLVPEGSRGCRTSDGSRRQDGGL